MAKASGNFATLWVRINFSLQISDLDRSPIKDGMCCDKPALQWCAEGGRGNWPMVGYETKNVAVDLTDRHVIGIA